MGNKISKPNFNSKQESKTKFHLQHNASTDEVAAQINKTGLGRATKKRCEHFFVLIFVSFHPRKRNGYTLKRF